MDERPPEGLSQDAEAQDDLAGDHPDPLNLIALQLRFAGVAALVVGAAPLRRSSRGLTGWPLP